MRVDRDSESDCYVCVKPYGINVSERCYTRHARVRAKGVLLGKAARVARKMGKGTDHSDSSVYSTWLARRAPDSIHRVGRRGRAQRQVRPLGQSAVCRYV